LSRTPRTSPELSGLAATGYDRDSVDYYPWEKLSSAVESLVGPEPIEERLRLASVSLLMLQHRPFDNTANRDSYVAIMDRLMHRDEDSMSTNEARSLAREILALHDSILTAQARDAVHGEMMNDAQS
jgi:hypothetical protein